ncbi:MAG: gamma-glutamylcyclotransferase [Myxococcota bacterium]
MTSALFVYGTLMEGQSQAGLLGGLPRRAGTVRGTLWDMPAGYPALGPGVEVVHGEIVSGVDERRLFVLDAYEGIDEGLYRRVEVEVQIGLRVEGAWAYRMDDPRLRGGRKVVSGRWHPTRRRG